VLVSTYNEPLITAEWAVAIFREARAAGLKTAFVSNGNATPQVLDYVRPHLDFYKVDLKSFDDRHYRELGGRIAPIVDSIRRIHDLGLWLEIVTLLIPGFNDGEDELKRLTAFVAEVSPDIPWHVTAFHARLQDDRSPRHIARRSAARRPRLAEDAGLRFVYAGNRPGEVGDLEDTPLPVMPRARRVAAGLSRDVLCADQGRRLPTAAARPCQGDGISRSRGRSPIGRSCRIDVCGSYERRQAEGLRYRSQCTCTLHLACGALYPPLVCISRCGFRLSAMAGTKARRFAVRRVDLPRRDPGAAPMCAAGSPRGRRRSRPARSSPRTSRPAVA